MKPFTFFRILSPLIFLLLLQSPWNMRIETLKHHHNYFAYFADIAINTPKEFFVR